MRGVNGRNEELTGTPVEALIGTANTATEGQSQLAFALPRTVVVGGKPMAVRLLTGADIQEVLRLHSEVFGSHVQPSWYLWKYQLGKGFAVGMWHEDRLIAHCGALPRRVMTSNSEAAGLQIADVMVSPSWRGLMTRSSPFFHVSNLLYQIAIGPLQGFSFGFGFPSHRHLRLAVKQQLLRDAGSLWSLCWDWSACPCQSLELEAHKAPLVDLEPSGFWFKFRHRLRALAKDRPPTASRRLVDFSTTIAVPLSGLPIDQREHVLETCWLNMREGFKDIDSTVLGVRNAEYLKWRFLNHPEYSYRYLMVSAPSSGQMPASCGLVVWKLEGDQATWLDWVGAPSWLPRALSHCAQAAQAAGAKRMTSWMSPRTASYLREWPEMQPVEPLTETPLERPPETPPEGLSNRRSLHIQGANLSVSEVARIGVPTTSCWPQTNNDRTIDIQGWWMGGDTDFL